MSTPTPDYGEPWVDNRHWRGSVMTREHNPVIDNTGLMKRALLCVNALAGIPDPAVEIAELRRERDEAREENARLREVLVECWRPLRASGNSQLCERIDQLLTP